MGATAFLLIALIVSLIVTRIASVALTLTGLSTDSARFQARSAFTGCGFTTSESEQLVNHPLRRKILMTLMLLGNAGLVTVAASLIVAFAGSGESGQWPVQLGLLVLGLVLIGMLAKSKGLDRAMCGLIQWALRRWTELEVRDYSSLLHLSGAYRVVETEVKTEGALAEKPLRELDLGDLLVLGVHQAGGGYVWAPHGDTLIHGGDTLILYGETPRLAAFCQFALRTDGS